VSDVDSRLLVRDWSADRYRRAHLVADADGRWHIGRTGVSAAQGRFRAGDEGFPVDVESVIRTIRKPMLYPLSYEGVRADPSCSAGVSRLGPSSMRSRQPGAVS